MACATATATPDPNRICDLHHSSQQCWILNPLSEARMEHAFPWVLVRFVTNEPQWELPDYSFFHFTTFFSLFFYGLIEHILEFVLNYIIYVCMYIHIHIYMYDLLQPTIVVILPVHTTYKNMISLYMAHL